MRQMSTFPTMDRESITVQLAGYCPSRVGRQMYTSGRIRSNLCEIRYRINNN